MKRIGQVPLIMVAGGVSGLVSHAGGALLTETSRRRGLVPMPGPTRQVVRRPTHEGRTWTHGTGEHLTGLLRPGNAGIVEVFDPH